MQNHRSPIWIGLLVVIVLLVASCGGGGDTETATGNDDVEAAGADGKDDAPADGSDGGGSPSDGDHEIPDDVEMPVVAEAVDGCANGATDTTDESPLRPVARCESGYPKPQPLDEPRKIVVSTGFTAEFVTPLFLADAFGEFEKENLEVEIVTLPFPDAIPQIANGQIDLAVGATDAALMNSADQGLGIKWAFGVYDVHGVGDPSVAQTGLWARRDVFSDPDDPDFAELPGKTIGSAIGIQNSTSWFIDQILEPYGASVTDLVFERVESADMVTALENGALDMAWLLDPYWVETAADSDTYVFVGGQTPRAPIGGHYYGRHLFEEDRDLGLAYTRALIRTINTYLAGDYTEDDDIVDAMHDVMGLPVEEITQTPALVFDWEIRNGVADGVQRTLGEVDALGYDDPVPEDRLLDQSLYEEVIAYSKAND